MADAIVVVGGGQAAASAVHTLRSEGFDDPLLILGAEPMLPYQRPPLSKEYLAGRKDAADTLVLPPDWYEEYEVAVRTGVRVVRIHPATREVEDADGRTVRARGVLLATGGRARTVPGWEGDRVLVLRTLEDADRLRTHLEPGRRLLVVGAGFIGSEVAATAHGLGVEVTVLEALEVPLERVLGRELGRICGELHRAHGVDLRTGVGVTAVREVADEVEVETTDGQRLRGDAVVVGIGMVPNTEVAEASGLEVDGGVVVDEYCRTAVPEITAAGDVAAHWHPLFGRRMRVEHYDNAIKQGAAAARALLGKLEVYDDPHWFWSDQYDRTLQFVGDNHGAEELVIRGDPDRFDLTAFWLADGVLRAAFSIGRPRDIRIATRLIAARARPDPAALRDEQTDLRTLL